jgi:hypothetical protein
MFAGAGTRAPAVQGAPAAPRCRGYWRVWSGHRCHSSWTSPFYRRACLSPSVGLAGWLAWLAGCGAGWPGWLAALPAGGTYVGVRASPFSMPAARGGGSSNSSSSSGIGATLTSGPAAARWRCQADCCTTQVLVARTSARGESARAPPPLERFSIPGYLYLLANLPHLLTLQNSPKGEDSRRQTAHQHIGQPPRNASGSG